MYDRWHVSVVHKNLPDSPPETVPGGRSSPANAPPYSPHASLARSVSLLLADRGRGQKLIRVRFNAPLPVREQIDKNTILADFERKVERNLRVSMRLYFVSLFRI